MPLRPLRAVDPERARTWAFGAAGVGVGAQLALAAGLTAWDAMRKRRAPQVAVPPHPPRRAEVEGNLLTTYTYGEHLFEDMLAAISGAQRQILLVTYIWKADEVGQRFKEAIVAAAERGVQVCVVFDGFANLVVPRQFKAFPPSVHVIKFPLLRGLPVVDVRRTGRDHRKVLVVDDAVGFVGGYNIGTAYATQWRDTHLRVEGEAVWELRNTFVDFWNRHRRRTLPPLEDSGSAVWNSRISAARNEPSRLVFPVRGLYLDAIDRAVHRIWITQAYFIPDTEVLAGLLAAARRGVDVRVILPAASNHVVADWVARSYWSRLLAGGVHLHLYQDAMVHAKTATVDSTWTTVGTANIDRLSLIGNYEVNLQVHDRGQAAQMEEIFAQDLERCEELTQQEWDRRGALTRLTERVLAPLRPLL